MLSSKQAAEPWFRPHPLATDRRCVPGSAQKKPPGEPGGFLWLSDRQGGNRTDHCAALMKDA